MHFSQKRTLSLQCNDYRLRIILFFIFLLTTLHCSLGRADNWSLIDKDGVSYTLSALHGKWVLINFWAPWCPPCIQEIPELNALQKQHLNLQIISIAVMYKTKHEVLEIMRNKTISYPIIFGDETIIADFGGIDSMPTSFLYDPSGTLTGRSDGILTRIEVENFISRN